MVGNFWIMFYLIDREGFSVETSFLGSLNMIQVSEFSLVVGALGVSQGYIGTEVLGYLSLMAVLTMSLSTYIINYNHEIYARVKPAFRRWESAEKTDVDLGEFSGHAVAVGFDGVTEGALPRLAERFDDVVVIDRNVDHIDELANHEEYETVYGDFRHAEIRKEANLSEAAFVLSSTVQQEVNERILAEADPDATVIVEGDTAEVARDLYDQGAHYVIMSTQLAADRLSAILQEYLDGDGRFEDIASDDGTRDIVPDRDTIDPTGGETDV